MTAARYSPAAAAEITRIYADPTQTQLADRLDEILDLLDTDPGNGRVRRSRMQAPKLWAVPVHGSGRDLVILWEAGDGGQPEVHYVGNAF